MARSNDRRIRVPEFMARLHSLARRILESKYAWAGHAVCKMGASSGVESRLDAPSENFNSTMTTSNAEAAERIAPPRVDSDAPVRKAPSGIAGFDEITRGGLPVGRTTL